MANFCCPTCSNLSRICCYVAAHFATGNNWAADKIGLFLSSDRNTAKFTIKFPRQEKKHIHIVFSCCQNMKLFLKSEFLFQIENCNFSGFRGWPSTHTNQKNAVKIFPQKHFLGAGANLTFPFPKGG